MQSTVLASHGLLQLLLILLLSIIRLVHWSLLYVRCEVLHRLTLHAWSHSAAVIGRYLVNATMEGRDHFATLPHSLRTAFIIFSGDNWAEVMFDAMASSKQSMHLFFSSDTALRRKLRVSVLTSNVYVIVCCRIMSFCACAETTAFGQSLVAGYFLLWISFSAFILFNLAVAIIINHFKISKLVDVIEGPGAAPA